MVYLVYLRPRLFRWTYFCHEVTAPEILKSVHQHAKHDTGLEFVPARYLLLLLRVDPFGMEVEVSFGEQALSSVLIRHFATRMNYVTTARVRLVVNRTTMKSMEVGE